MWYDGPHEATNLCSPTHRGRAQAARNGFTFLGCLCVTSQPDSARQFPWRTGAQHRQGTQLRPANRSQCDPRLQTIRARSPACGFTPSPSVTHNGGSHRGRCLQSSAAPSSPRFWVRDESVDALPGRQRVCQARLDHAVGQFRDHSPDAQEIGDQLETSQALDHQSRSAVFQKKPSGQRIRGSGSSPESLERSEIDLSLVAETKALELLTLGGFGLPSEFSPASTIESAGALYQLALPVCILFPPIIIGDTAPVAQQIAVPVLAPADAAILRLEGANAAFQLVVRARERLPIVTLHQVRTLVGEHLQKLGETLLLQLRERAVAQAPG